MKKLFYVVVCLMLVSVMAFSAAAAGSSVSITPSVNRLDRGDTFTIVAQLSNTDPIKLATVVLEFDEAIFELTGGTCHVDGATLGMVKPEQKVGTMMLQNATVVSGKIFTFEFKVKADAPYGTYEFTTIASVGTATGERIDATGTTVTIACRHEYGALQKLDDAQHQRTCEKCGNVEKKDHSWQAATVTVKPSCEQGGEQQSKCASCEAVTTSPLAATGHKWENDCDTDCNNGCGTTRTTEHTYETTFTSDATGHWYSCSVCQDKKDFAAHTPGPAATVTEPQVCLDCNFEIAPKITHEHQLSTEWITDEDYHWHRCQWNNPSCYYVTDKAEHDYDNDCDSDCNTCGFIRLNPPHNYMQEWQGDADGHWYVCLDCFAQSDVKAHIPGPEATDSDPQRCKECNIVIKMPLSHVHMFGDMWYYDEESHWQCCTDIICFEVTPLVPHIWDEGLELADGGKEYACTVCGKKMVTAGSAPTQPSTPPTTQAPTTAPNQDNTAEEGGFNWEWIAIAAIVLLVIGLVLLIIEFIRSRKHNSHGRFSK